MSSFPHATQLREVLSGFPAQEVERFLGHALIIWELSPEMRMAATRKARLARLRKAMTAMHAALRALEASVLLDIEYERPASAGAFIRRMEEAGGLKQIEILLREQYCSKMGMVDPEYDDPEMGTSIATGDLALIATLLDAREKREARIIEMQCDVAPPDPSEMLAIAESVRTKRAMRPHLESLREAAIHSVREFELGLRSETARATKPRRGRKQADKDGRITELARSYVSVFGEMPSSTREPPSPFYQFVAILTRRVAPDRAVQHAVKTLREEMDRYRRAPEPDEKVLISSAILSGQLTLDRAIKRQRGGRRKQRN